MESVRHTYKVPYAAERYAPWTMALWRRLLLGPVDYYKVRQEMAVLVPPGRAFRQSETASLSQRMRHNNGAAGSARQYADAEGAKDRKIASGQRRVVMSNLHNFVKRGRIVICNTPEGKIVKPGPNFWPFDPPSTE